MPVIVCFVGYKSPILDPPNNESPALWELEPKWKHPFSDPELSR